MTDKIAEPAIVVSDKAHQQMTPIADEAMNLHISDSTTYAQAGELLNVVKKAAKTFKAEKDKVLKPVKDMVKAYEAVLKPTENQLKDLETLLKGKMLSYNEEVSAKAAEEAERLDRKIESGYIKAPETIMRNMMGIKTVNNAEAGVKESMITKVRITDMSQIPAEYLLRPKVQEAILVELRKDMLGNKAQGIEPIEVPGAETYQEKILSV